MAIKQVAPHGLWKSPITAESVAAGTRSLAAPRVSPRTGRAFYTETRDGRRIITEVTDDGGVVAVLPAPYSVANRVYEYGGSLHDVLCDGRIVFSDGDDAVRTLDPDSGAVSLLLRGAGLRYSSFSAAPASAWVLAVEEDHRGSDGMARNCIVAINAQTAQVKTVAAGADFYYSPLLSPDGGRVAWLEWDRPGLPFDAARLVVAAWRDDGSVCGARLVSGRNGEGVAEPRWGPDGSLFFAQELAGEYRQLYRVRPGHRVAVPIKLKGLETAELGEIGLFEGSRTYAPLTKHRLVASAVTNGIAKLIAVNLDTMDWWEIADSEAFCLLKGDAMARFDDTAVLAISTGVAVAETLYRFDIRGPAFCKAIRSSADMPMPRGLLSRPTPVAIRATQPPARTTYGFLWMPRSPWFTAPAGERPPLIISAHGGPTGYSGCGLAPRVQYFTSRGYAFLALNYAGSTAHGRRYRNALFGSWGLLDVDDAAEAAGALVRDGTVRPGAVGLTGLSAGGYSTLMGLARHPRAFAGGVAVSSISDVRRWAATTHKLEADYAPALALPAGTKKADEARVYRERSALFAADEVAAPLLIIHGEADAVVPLEQATLMADALRARGADVRLVTVKGEGHQVNKPASARLWLEEEERWWRRTLL